MNIPYYVILISVCCVGCAATKYNPPQEDVDMHSIDDGSMQKIPWDFEGDEGERFMNDMWDIRTTMKYQHIVDSLPIFYTALLQRYSTVFGELPLPASQMDVYLFATQEQWQSQLVKMLGRREAQHWFQLESGGITIDGKAILYHLDRRGRSRVTLRIAAHEGWHQYAEKIFKAPEKFITFCFAQILRVFWFRRRIMIFMNHKSDVSNNFFSIQLRYWKLCSSHF